MHERFERLIELIAQECKKINGNQLEKLAYGQELVDVMLPDSGLFDDIEKLKKYLGRGHRIGKHTEKEDITLLLQEDIADELQERLFEKRDPTKNGIRRI